MLPLSRQFIGGSSRLTLIAPVGWSNLVSRSVGSSTPSPNTSYSASADVPAPGVLPYPGPAPTSRLEAIQRLYGVKIQLSGRLPTDVQVCQGILREVLPMLVEGLLGLVLRRGIDPFDAPVPLILAFWYTFCTP